MIDRDDHNWYQDAIIYQLHVKSFFDSNNDGIGDFAGVSQKLDYIKDLGATAIWIMPFYPSTLRDDGYDIADYRGVNEAYGSMRDFRRLVRDAHARGIRVIIELIVNHTSDQHPWFQRARKSVPGSSARNFYVWSDTDKRYSDARIIFVDTETSNWTWDPVAKAYYWHRFYSHQPDLNFDNPQVLRAILDTMNYWLDTGVDGLRLDAVPYLIERDGTNCENLPETHAIIRRMREEIDKKYPGRMLLAEANQWPEETAAYFGDGDECHMAFHFPLMPRMYMALAMEDRHPITDIMRQTPEIPTNAQWAIFLRNHDELTLEMVTDKERDYLWTFYASDNRARINLGIRRRLAPLLGNDRRKIELLNSLLFSMQGTPVFYYGDEIGMGDNIYLGDRDGVRTPMQWSPDRNAGFSRADPAKLFLLAIQDAIYGFSSVNVESQLASPASLLNWMRRMSSVRRNYRAFGRGGLRFLYPDNRKVLAYLREYGDEKILCVSNVSGAPQAVELDLSEFRGASPIELTGGSRFPAIGALPYMLTLPSYGFLWLSLDASEPEKERFGPNPAFELFTLVLTGSSADLLKGREGHAFEHNVAPRYLRARRWFAGKNSIIANVKLSMLASSPLPERRQSTFLLSRFDVTMQNGEAQSYFVPIVVDEAADEDFMHGWAIARVRRGSRMGLLSDAEADPYFGPALISAVKANAHFPASDGGEIFCVAHATLPPGIEHRESRRLGADQSNSTLLVGEDAIIKIYRRLWPGGNPELEMVQFLCAAGFDGIPGLLGSITHIDSQGARTPLAIIQRFVRNQGDAWTRSVHLFRRAFEDVLMAPEERGTALVDLLAPFFPLMQTLGGRTAEMHMALAQPCDDPAFCPEMIDQVDLVRFGQEGERIAEAAWSALERVAIDSEPLRVSIAELMARRGEVFSALNSLSAAMLNTVKFRFHGDFHLGQVLIVQQDVCIVDYEGEPLHGASARFAKDTPLRDVAGMLRSIDYAAAAAVQAIEQRLLTDPQRAERMSNTGADFVSAAFLEAYDLKIAGSPAEVQDRDARKKIVSLKFLIKALYEIRYEAEFRPAWIGLPVRGVLNLLDHMSNK